jgi:hypothetical protein
LLAIAGTEFQLQQLLPEPSDTVTKDFEPDLDQISAVFYPETDPFLSAIAIEPELSPRFGLLSKVELRGPNQRIGYVIFKNSVQNPHTMPTGLKPFFRNRDEYKHLWGPRRYGFIIFGQIFFHGYINAFAQVIAIFDFQFTFN